MSLDVSQEVFPGPLAEWDVNKVLLVNWLRFYHNFIFSVAEEERPPENLWDYDLIFDDWIDAKERKRQQDAQKARREGK